MIFTDRVSKAKSIYKQYLWGLHIDLKNIQQSLEFRDYTRVIGTLAFAKEGKDRQFAEGFYHILCNSIIASADHLEAIIKLTGKKYFEMSSNGRYRPVSHQSKRSKNT